MGFLIISFSYKVLSWVGIGKNRTHQTQLTSVRHFFKLTLLNNQLSLQIFGKTDNFQFQRAAVFHVVISLDKETFYKLRPFL